MFYVLFLLCFYIFSQFNVDNSEIYQVNRLTCIRYDFHKDLTIIRLKKSGRTKHCDKKKIEPGQRQNNVSLFILNWKFCP